VQASFIYVYYQQKYGFDMLRCSYVEMMLQFYGR